MLAEKPIIPEPACNATFCYDLTYSAFSVGTVFGASAKPFLNPSLEKRMITSRANRRRSC